MPLSRRRKKNGKVVKNNPDKRAERLEEADISAGVTLQDLINVVAYQEYGKNGELPHQIEETKENEDGGH